MSTRLFLYSGEGTRGEQSSRELLRKAPRWGEIDTLVQDLTGHTLDRLWHQADRHHCPHSPLLTVVSQICLSDIWKSWGYEPDIVLGHSIGELSGAHAAGIYSLAEVLELTWQIGRMTARLDGAMAHGVLPEREIEGLGIGLAARNFEVDGNTHITVCGPGPDIDIFVAGHPGFHRMMPAHPWHHHGYRDLASSLTPPPGGPATAARFVSGVTGRFAERLGDDHWQRWAASTIDFVGAMRAIGKQLGEEPVEVVEIGFHPVLKPCCTPLPSCTYASSMYRGEEPVGWMHHERRKLDDSVFRQRLDRVIEEFQPGLAHDIKLSYQGLTSLRFVALASRLEPFFPGLAPQDFYRYQTIRQLVEQFGSTTVTVVSAGATRQRQQVVIAGMSCRFPADAQSPLQFWELLRHRQDQVRAETLRGDYQAGFLAEPSTRFDHRFFDIPEAEARTMDPQQILALELAELLFQDSGLAPDGLDRTRVGVYLGVWNEEFDGDRNSVYYPTGTNPSIVASRISYHYDLRGPSWVVNTACSSSLVAIHYACKDIEAGRIDYAIAGGVNLLLGNDFSRVMRDAGFLSPDQRCKAFDDAANGYVRAEGGGLVMLARKELVSHYYAEILGSAVNQNGGRPQVITAPHPEAQEELIIEACRDAGLTPAAIDYVECHGTGTRIGDPIEFSALQNTVGRDRTNDCLLGAVKASIGHLESAAGIAGLIKALLALHQGVVPANLHFNTPNRFIDFTSHRLKVVDRDTEISREARVGISSFGFGGANAHLIIQGVDEHHRKPLEERQSPFDRHRGTPLSAYYRLAPEPAAATVAAAAGDRPEARDMDALVARIFTELTGVSELDPEVELTDQGLDSLSATEFITMLQQHLGFELDPELLFDHPLPGQLIGRLRELGGAAPAAGRAAGRPGRQEIERAVGELFYELTNVREINPDVELTDQGLDSLSATQFIAQLETRFGIQIDGDILFDQPLYEQLVERLHDLSRAA